MTKEELIEKHRGIEWEDFEVKAAKSDIPKSICETVSSFSNTSSGWIIFGVEQNGTEFLISGVKNPEKIEQDFINVLRGDKFNVKIVPKCAKFNFSEKLAIAFYIPISTKSPFIMGHL
ncbi:MAG: ATP-binding protein [Bacteroidales bacterium]|nr:ATP-binding protein [Bacteroidales bacterium]